MSSQISHPVQAVAGSPPSSGGVRRHHTISAASRTARASAKETISEESQNPELWNDDEVVGEDWVGGVGVVGEKSSLHRQASLPTKYHRGFQTPTSNSGSMTPKTMNSLTAIAGHEGDEEEWEKEIGGYVVPEEEQVADTNESYGGSIQQVPSPPPATSGVRRHVSLTYGAQGAGVNRPKVTSLKRSGTLQTPLPANNAATMSENATAGGEAEEYEYTYGMEDPAAYNPYDYDGPTSPLGRSSPWGSTGSSSGSAGDWRTPGGPSGPNAIDDVQRALSSLELSGAGTPGTFGQSAHPPRFNPAHPPPPQAPGMRGGNGGNGNGTSKLQQVTDFDGRKTPLSQAQPFNQPMHVTGNETLTGRVSNPNLQYAYSQHQKSASGSSSGGGERIPNVPLIPSQYLQQNQQQQLQGHQQPRLGIATSFVGGQNQQAQGQSNNNVPSGQTPTQAFSTPIDVSSLIATKGYNPSTFDIRPQSARFFVIKSYTEDDVHKSLKYEIWSSTDPGNKRLDKAFKECAGRGPIYLFFSVNASGHFCGMAEMLTPVDYTRSSTVWASDKWKGVFKVRWIFVRDIPNVNLRHIKLNNTQERKPVTNSRDTQELLTDAGQEMLRIFHTHPARTSLLQDFAFYELQAMQKIQAQSNPSSPISNPGGPFNSPPMQNLSPIQPGQQSPLLQQQQASNLFAMQSGNPNALSYQMPQMTPMMQMQMMGMNMGGGLGMGNMGGMNNMAGSQFPMSQSQAMHQSVMRHPSPAPGSQQQQGGGQGFMGFQ